MPTDKVPVQFTALRGTFSFTKKLHVLYLMHIIMNLYINEIGMKIRACESSRFVKPESIASPSTDAFSCWHSAVVCI